MEDKPAMYAWPSAAVTVTAQRVTLMLIRATLRLVLSAVDRAKTETKNLLRARRIKTITPRWAPE